MEENNNEKINLRRIFTMDDSIKMMNSSDYKERFIAEYIQVKIRYEKLHKLIVKMLAETLDFKPTCSQEILEDQAYYMGNYLKVLEIRAEIEGIELPSVFV